jgi:hypothetical protein
MKITNKQLAIGGGIIILLLLLYKRKPTAIVAAEEVEEGLGGAVGGGGVETRVLRESIITPVVVGATQTIPPVMNISAPTAPYAIGSTSNVAPPSSNVAPSRETPTAPASTPAISKPATSPLVNANARFDGLDDYSFDGAIGF